MHLLCTHEQADFDAVASLWAARLLEPEAIPVLPKRLNRNVRAYLTLYGANFAFVDRSELDPGALERVTLVDTQTLASIKGVRSETSVTVIDHHPLEPDLDAKWSIQVEPVGATTTLLIEALRDRGSILDRSSATLLLLGLYEDTGSLSYPGTGSRDIGAAAWLLEQGADLVVANEYLNQPLSTEQRALFEALLETASVYSVQGFEIVIALGDASETEDEVSTLAHRLGDVYDAAGLFLLIALNGSVQLVARSYSEAVDVGEIAEQFGGGGHSRAAAARIKGASPEDLRRRLLQLLEELVQPISTVGEIMSKGPQVLDPSQTVEDAAERMKRFGHEGYPVTDHGEVVGLLTRRSVDRAMSHGMERRPVSEIMEAGTHVVHPDDSIRHLQRVMIEHNWGQIPVSDPDTGEVIGIVTRTDLINSYESRANSSDSRSLARKLEEALPPGRLALLGLISSKSQDEGTALYVVGGFVRDLILDTPSQDFDLVVEGDAIALASRLAKEYGGTVNSHRRFGTAKWQLDSQNERLKSALEIEFAELPGSVDFVSARTEFYSHPTALPSVSEGSIKLDLHRRDFSINTLALRLDGRYYGQLLDPWGGGRDLREGQVRVLHSLSFVDDPTRMLRAVRLEQRLGFSIEERTLELMDQALPLLDSVSGERVRSELRAILKEPNFDVIMRRLDELGLVRAIHPALEWDEWIQVRSGAARTFKPHTEWDLAEDPDLEILLYALLVYRLTPEEAGAIGERLHLSQTESSIVIQAGRQSCDLLSDLRPSEYVSCLESEPEGALVASWLADEDRRPILEQYLARWRWIRPTTDGDRLRDLGLAAGPEYGMILDRLRTAWLDGEISSHSEEQALLTELMGRDG